MTFDDLNLTNPLKNALADLDIINPTAIQEKSFSTIMSGRDVVGLAQTGTGKTLAYLLPLFRMLPYSNQPEPRVLVMVPTRELVVQVVEMARQLTTYMNVRVEGVYGGTNMNTQKELLEEGLDVLVATPGRLLDLALDGALRLKKIQKLVIDEVDEMLDLGFRVQLARIHELLPERRQSLMFSATMTQAVEKIITDNFDRPIVIEAAAPGTPVEQIFQTAYNVPNFYTKVNLLNRLLADDPEMSRVLVFTSSKRQADWLYNAVAEMYPDQFGMIHSNKSQNFRFNSLTKFQEGTHRVLIATDLVARGLDLSDVTHVINMDTPKDPTTYIHRIGRTGRADKRGVAITFTTDEELPMRANIEGLMKKSIPLTSLPEGLEVSEKLTEEEDPTVHEGSSYRPPKKKGPPAGAFHEKKAKNKKVNSGGLWQKKIGSKYKKPKTKRGSKRKRG